MKFNDHHKTECNLKQNKRCLRRSKNPDEMVLKIYLMNRLSPFSVNVFV